MAKKSPNISFDEVTLCVGQGQEKKNILNKISGSFPSGNLIGILGPSGAGKTSLLNILSGWGHQGKVTGEIKVNGKPLRWKSFKSISCYITQDSHLNDTLSIEENMTFAADLKLGPRISQNTKYSLIKDTLESFGLTECKDTITSDLSGGQRKLLSICLELLSDPDVIFLDEPTTGLDIVSMFHCMRYLKNLALDGNTVVCTLHQPPDQIFEIFDIVYIISNGKCAYQGGSKELVSFLDYSGVPCEIFHSPLDFLVEIAAGDYGRRTYDAVMNTSQNGKNLDYLPLIHKESEAIEAVGKTRTISSKWRNYSIYDDFYEFRTLLHREMVKVCRDVYIVYLRIIGLLIISILGGILFYNMGSDATMHYFNYNMILMHVAGSSGLCALFSNISFTLQQHIVRNEYQNKYYSIWNYYMVNVLLDAPIVFIATWSSAFMIYWLSGQTMAWHRFFMFGCITFETGMVASALGFLIGSIFDFNKSIFLVTSIHIPIFALSGFGISIHDIPPYFKFATSLAYTRYTVRSLMDVVFGYNRPLAHCPEEIIYCHYRDSKRFLDEMGLEDFYFLYDAVALIGFYFAVRLASYPCIQYRLKNLY